MKRILVVGGAALLAILLLIQAVPYGRAHENPAVLAEPEWDSQETQDPLALVQPDRSRVVAPAEGCGGGPGAPERLGVGTRGAGGG
jgi:hypothetical protein